MFIVSVSLLGLGCCYTMDGVSGVADAMPNLDGVLCYIVESSREIALCRMNGR